MARILLVEDEDVQRKAVEAMLKSGDHVVLLATNGATALVLAQDKKPDVILSDLSMPKMDGKTLCEKIRASPGLESTYIIVVTGMEGEVPRLESMLAGADDFVRKPIQREDLMHRLEIGVTMRSLRREVHELKGKAGAFQKTQDSLASALDAALRGIEDGVSRLNAGDPPGALALLQDSHEAVRQALSKISLPEA
jgi:adenylate cyclase